MSDPMGSEASSRAKPDGEKLICRYCGSDDLAPSFRRRQAGRALPRLLQVADDDAVGVSEKRPADLP